MTLEEYEKIKSLPKDKLVETTCKYIYKYEEKKNEVECLKYQIEELKKLLISNGKVKNMTLQEAIKDIEENGIKLGAGDYVSLEALEIAKQCMDKRLPLKVRRNAFVYDYANGKFPYNTCFNCDCKVLEKQNYCSNCGQALDWGED